MLSLVLVCLVSDICSLYTSVSVSYMCTACWQQGKEIVYLPSPLLCTSAAKCNGGPVTADHLELQLIASKRDIENPPLHPH